MYCENVAEPDRVETKYKLRRLFSVCAAILEADSSSANPENQKMFLKQCEVAKMIAPSV